MALEGHWEAAAASAVVVAHLVVGVAAAGPGARWAAVARVVAKADQAEA